MSVLAREIEAYQSALDTYMRQLRAYNFDAKTYNSSIFTNDAGQAYVRDANGTVYIVGDGGALKSASLPNGKIAGDYGGTELPDNPGYYLMRINPTEQKTSTISGVQKSVDPDTGQTQYFKIDNTGDSSYTNYINQNLYRLVSEQPGYYVGDNYYAPTYTFATDASTYVDNPGEFTKQIRMKAPDPTLSQLKKLAEPSNVEMERGGLISNEIIGKGRNPYL